MNIPAEIREKALQEDLQNLECYVKKVWNTLEAMKPGDSIRIASITKPRFRDLFIECAKWYMDDHRETNMDGLSFTKGFESIQKWDVTALKQTSMKSNTVTV